MPACTSSPSSLSFSVFGWSALASLLLLLLQTNVPYYFTMEDCAASDSVLQVLLCIGAQRLRALWGCVDPPPLSLWLSVL